MRTRILIVALLACGCSAEPPAESSAASVPEPISLALALPDSVASDWREFRGDDFRLRYPPNANVAPGRSHPNDWQGTAITGPRVHVATPVDVGPSEGPAYELVVSTARKGATQTLEAWVDSLVAVRNAELDPDWRIGPPDTVVVGTERGLQLRPSCGDCDPFELYVARGESVVVLTYLFDSGFPGERTRQLSLYQLILGTFEWTP